MYVLGTVGFPDSLSKDMFRHPALHGSQTLRVWFHKLRASGRKLQNSQPSPGGGNITISAHKLIRTVNFVCLYHTQLQGGHIINCWNFELFGHSQKSEIDLFYLLGHGEAWIRSHIKSWVNNKKVQT